jgi:putative hydrolase of the HAD superfamily
MTANHSSATHDELRTLCEGIRLLCLDAGNTVIYLDHARLAELLATNVHSTRFAPTAPPTAQTLIEAEGRAKVRAEQGQLIDPGLTSSHAGFASWSKMLASILVEARYSGTASELGETIHTLWGEHVRLNLWSRVPADLPDALRALRARGVAVIIVSNSEGMLRPLFSDLGILDCFDHVLDSGLLGIEKPDPRIFQMALDHVGVHHEQALHLGDVYATDVLGARAANLRVGLIDPFDHYRGRHPDVPRVPDAATVARALLSQP